MRSWVAVAFAIGILSNQCTSDIFMVVEYDTNGTARPVLLNVALRTVELHVTLLGCDHGYYAHTYQPSLVCLECVCTEFREGRSEAFVEAVD